MGLLGKNFDTKGALISFFSPEGGAAYQRRKAQKADDVREDEKLRLVQDARKAAYLWAKSQGMGEAEAQAVASDPNTVSAMIAEQRKPRQFSASGGSIATLGPDGKYAYDMAPSRHEYQGSVFDVSGGPVGQQATVTPQHEGTQWVTPQPGTTAFGVNSFNGARRFGPPPAAPQIGNMPTPTPPTGAGPAPGTVEDGYRFKGGDPADERNWIPVQGGAGSRGPRNFPRFPQ